MEGTNGLGGRVISAMIDFDLVVNTELGLIRFIRNNFQDERAFKLEVLNKSDSDILSLLYSRENENPLSIISTEENLGSIDSLYNSFFEKYKKEIIDESNSDSTIFRFAEFALGAGQNFGANIVFAVNDDLESKSLVSHFGALKTASKKDPSSIIGRDAYYIKDYRFFTNLNLQDKISKCKIYFSPRKYNFNYFENVFNSLTARNVYSTFGKDYSKVNKHDTNSKGEIKHE